MSNDTSGRDGEPQSSVLATGRRRGSVAKLASSTYLSTMLGVVSGPIVARVLGADGRGEYAAVMIYSSTSVFLLSLGMFLSVEYAALTQREDPRVIYGNALRFACFLILPAGIMAVCVLPLVWDFGATSRVGVVVLVAIAPLGVLQLCLNALLTAEGALGSLTAIRMLPLFLNFAGVVTLAALGLLTVASYLVLTLVGILATLLLAVRSMRIRPRGGGKLRPQLRFGMRAYPGSLAGLANNQLDQLLIAPLLGARDLGHYAVAVTLANLPLGMALALSTRSVREMSQPEGGLNTERTAHEIRRTIVLSALVSVMLAAFIPGLVPMLYGSAFSEVVGLSLVLMLGTVAVAIGATASPALALAGRPGAASVAQLVALVATAGGLAVSLPLLGVLGAAVTTAVAYWVRAAMLLWSLRKCGVRGLLPKTRDLRDVSQIIVQRSLHAYRRFTRMLHYGREPS
jgi:O-antigen/teichoic acid export membrane protein